MKSGAPLSRCSTANANARSTAQAGAGAPIDFGRTVAAAAVDADVRFANAPTYRFPLSAEERAEVRDKQLLGIPSLEGFTGRRSSEPEIADVASCLIAMGANITGAGSSTIQIEGVDELRPTDHTAVPDRIEAGTWAAAAVATQGDVTIENARPKHLELFLAKLRDTGTEVSVSDAGLRIRQSTRARAVDFVTLPYPGIATDFQPILLAMLATAEGTAIVTENVFESRFLYVGELLRMGADIRTEGHHAVIRGVPRLSAAPVRALDIRAGAAMVIAALCADGVSEIDDMQHVDRGYEDFEAKLEGLGADVRRERELVDA